MEIKNEEKNKKFISSLKNKILKREYNLKNQSIHNIDSNEYNILKTPSYNKEEKTPKLNPIKNKKGFNMSIEKENLIKTNTSRISNSNKNILKLKNENNNNNLYDLFYTTSKVIKKQKFLRKTKPSINIFNYNSNIVNDQEGKKKLLNEIFPDINEISKYSNLPFFSFVKMKIPNKLKVNTEEMAKKIPKEKFLYKISHNIDEEKINNKIDKNKGIKKGTTSQYFHGVDNFCINNKLSETNFFKEDLNKKEKLKLDINNLGGEKIPQLNNKERHIKILKNNLKNLKSISGKLVDEFEDGVFKFFDEEYDNSNNNIDIFDIPKKIAEYKNKLTSTSDPDSFGINRSTMTNNENNNSTNTNNNINNIVNLSNQFKLNNINNRNKLLIAAQNISKNKSKYDRNNNNIINSNNNTTGLKRPLRYPINFYSVQQIKNKEGFNDSHIISFEERAKRIEKEYMENRKNHFNHLYQLNFNTKSLQKKKKVITNSYAYKKESRIRDMIIGNKLKCEFSPVDIKRVLNGLKPWVDVKSEEKINLENNSGDKNLYLD